MLKNFSYGQKELNAWFDLKKGGTSDSRNQPSYLCLA